MAFTIPESIAARAATAGERKVFEALRDHLPEDWIVYYDTAVRSRHPDFIVVGPRLGLVVLEVKDWRLGSIVAITGDDVVLHTAEGERTTKNPVQQAREYVLRVVDALKRRPLLCDENGLRFGWGYGVIFPRLTRADIRTRSLFGPSLEEALETARVLAAEDIEPASLLPALRRFVPAWAAGRTSLTPLQVDDIRGTIHPEVRIGWGCTGEEIERVMDREQERLAGALGEGHRLLRGVAGSGKTICLIGRARYLRTEYPEWRILVLCFNRVLAEHLREAIGKDDHLQVLHFHRWCWRDLEAAGIVIPEPPPVGERDDYWDREIPQLVLKTYEEGRLPTGRYQAILVDEGQDFADDWYRVVLRALDPTTNSLLITIDSSQEIYRRKVSWREIGIQVVGRARVFRVNYRNTRQILALAYGLIQDLDAAGSIAREADQEYVVPDQALRDGPFPEIRRCGSPQQSRVHALEWIRARLARGAAPEDIPVLGLSRLDTVELERWLEDRGVAAGVLGGRREPGTVRLSTIHSAKGLDAPHVIVLGTHQLERLDPNQARRLLYIAMTRARTDLCISYCGDSPLMMRLEELAKSVQRM